MIVFEDCGDQMTWRFEGIQGDDTKDALDSDYTSEFNERVTDDLDDLNRKGTYGEVFAKELNHLAWLKENRLAGDVFVLFCSFIVFFLVAVVIVWAFVYGIRVDTKLIQAKEVTRCPADADGRPMPVMTVCPHCGERIRPWRKTLSVLRGGRSSKMFSKKNITFCADGQKSGILLKKEMRYKP